VNPFYRAVRTIFRPILRLYNRLEVRGLEHFPAEGPGIVVANHHSYMDPFVLGASAPRKLHFMVKRSLFRKWFARWFYWGMDAFAVNQDGNDQEAVRKALRLLGSGGIVALYPSGTRCTEPGPGEWHMGAGLLAKHAGVPVVPAAIVGTFRAHPRSAFLPRPFKVVVVFGEPEAFSGGRGKGALEDFVERIRSRVAAMLESGLPAPAPALPSAADAAPASGRERAAGGEPA
jgi:1-acyl-sn-glycerol-3-phosphate acyltransferase